MKAFLFLFLGLICLSGFCQEGDEVLIEEIQNQRAQQAEMDNQIGQTSDQIQNNFIDFPGELRKLGHETIDAVALSDEKVVELVRKMIGQNSLSKVSQQEAAQLILEKSQGTQAHQFLRDRPKLVNAFADVLRNEQALSSAIGLFLRKDDLKLYFFIWLCFMILGWLFKKIFFKKDWPKAQTMLYGFVVSLVFSTMSLTVFYQMFHKELSPTAKILWTHWRKRNL